MNGRERNHLPHGCALSWRFLRQTTKSVGNRPPFGRAFHDVKRAARILNVLLLLAEGVASGRFPSLLLALPNAFGGSGDGAATNRDNGRGLIIPLLVALGGNQNSPFTHGNMDIPILDRSCKKRIIGGMACGQPCDCVRQRKRGGLPLGNIVVRRVATLNSSFLNHPFPFSHV
jgi:hypothetical protein